MKYSNLFEKEDVGCGVIIAAVLALIALVFFEIAIIYWCWNGIVVPYFNAPELDYWTVFGLKIMVNSILPTNTSFLSKQ